MMPSLFASIAAVGLCVGSWAALFLATVPLTKTTAPPARTVPVVWEMSAFAVVNAQQPAAVSIDQLIDRLAELRSKRTDLDKQEQGVVELLREKLREQLDRLRKLGVDVGLTPSPQPPPTPPPQPPQPPVPPPQPTVLDRLKVAYRADRGEPEDVRTLAAILENAGKALDNARPGKVLNLRLAVGIVARAQLREKLPTVRDLVEQQIQQRFPPDDTAMTPEVGTACKLVLLDLSAVVLKVP